MEKGHIADHTSEPTNALLLSPSFNSHCDHVCSDLLVSPSHDRTALLHVTNRESVDESIRRWMPQANTAPAEIGIIAMGESTRSATTTSVRSAGATQLTLETIAHPGDLTGAGIKITELLKQWHESDRQIVACVDSITVLLQYAPIEKVYQFLHVLTQQMKTAGVVAHYHMDPSAHDDETVFTLLSLFETVFEFDADGIESVQTR